MRDFWLLFWKKTSQKTSYETCWNWRLTDVWAVLTQWYGCIIAPDFCVVHRWANSGLSTLNRTKSILSIYHQQRQLQKQRARALMTHTPFVSNPCPATAILFVSWNLFYGQLPAAAPLSGPLCRTRVFSRLSLFYNFLPLSLFLNGNIISYGRANGNIFSLGMRKPPFEAEQGTIIKNHEETFSFSVYFSPSFLYGITLL